MKQTGYLRQLFLYGVPALSLLGLLVAAVSIATPAAPPKPPKPPRFPLSLFAQATPDDYSDEHNCRTCHRVSVETFERSPHALFMKDPNLPQDKQGCQACHGPSRPHVLHRKVEEGRYSYVISYTQAKPEQISAACLRCHQATLSERHWKLTGHAHAGITCTNCHQIHWLDRTGKDRGHPSTPNQKIDMQTNPVSETPKTPVYADAPEPKALLKADEPTLCGQCHRKELAEFRHNFHHPVPEGRMVCSDCHSIHSNRDERKQMQVAQQNCITCHAHTAGPFVFDHDPVHDPTGLQCMECHRPHGSPNPRLLNAFSRGLCTQCHTDKAANHNPGRGCWDAGCHSAVHGSNHDQLLFRR